MGLVNLIIVWLKAYSCSDLFFLFILKVANIRCFIHREVVTYHHSNSTCIWSIYLSVDPIFQSLWFLSEFRSYWTNDSYWWSWSHHFESFTTMTWLNVTKFLPTTQCPKHKARTTIYKTTHRKRQIEHQEHPWKLLVNPGAP
jgi:hypothetical protein